MTKVKKRIVSAKIKGGYVLLAKRWDESEIAYSSPCTREVFLWLLRKARYMDENYRGTYFKRGELLCTYEAIQDGLHWFVGFRKNMYSKAAIEHSMKWLMNRGMITKRKTTRGLIVSICKYDYYQDHKAYEGQLENVSKTTTRPQAHDTIENEVNEANESNKLTKKERLGLYEDFYSIYRQLNNKGKEEAKRAWAGLSDAECLEAIEHVKKYVPVMIQGDPQYFRHAKNYLRNKDFKEEIKQPSKPNTKNGLHVVPLNADRDKDYTEGYTSTININH